VILSATVGSAEFLPGVHADLALPVAGVALAISSVTRPEGQRLGRRFLAARSVGIWLPLMWVTRAEGDGRVAEEWDSMPLGRADGRRPRH
jgi:hypothetical protein